VKASTVKASTVKASTAIRGPAVVAVATVAGVAGRAPERREAVPVRGGRRPCPCWVPDLGTPSDLR
jgi:hypothetical protein